VCRFVFCIATIIFAQIPMFLFNLTNKQTTETNSMMMADTVKITYVDPDGTSKTVDAEIGQNLMQVAHDNDIELEGACGGELACSTCHLIFEQGVYDSLPEKEEEEDDMLDLAMEVTETYVVLSYESVCVCVLGGGNEGMDGWIYCWKVTNVCFWIALHYYSCRSRLGCQILAQANMEGTTVRVLY
jgi:ferredoxin